MANESLLLDFVARREAARDAGQPISPELLCQDCPELLEPLRSAIKKLHGHAAITVSVPLADTDTTNTFTPNGGKNLPNHPYRAGQVVAGFTLLRPIGEGASVKSLKRKIPSSSGGPLSSCCGAKLSNTPGRGTCS